jgi:hypothetical protein
MALTAASQCSSLVCGFPRNNRALRDRRPAATALHSHARMHFVFGIIQHQRPAGLAVGASTIAPPRILFPPASASIPSRTRAPPPPEDAVGSGYADTIHSYPAQTASHTDLRDYTVRLTKWRERHCLCRRCDSQGKGSNGNRPDHFFSSLLTGV